MPAQQPPARPVNWLRNLDRIRPTDDNLGDNMVVDPSPATRDANEVRKMQRTPGAQVEGFAKGGKVKATAKKPKGYADGGKVTDSDVQRPGRVIRQPQPAKPQPWPAGRDPSDDWFAEGKAKGGKIKRVAGKPIGKEDGLIAAQKGEYVIRKAAARKYGDRKMAAVNAGIAKVSVPKK